MEQAIGERLAGKRKPTEPPKPDTRTQAALAFSKLGASKEGKARGQLNLVREYGRKSLKKPQNRDGRSDRRVDGA